MYRNHLSVAQQHTSSRDEPKTGWFQKIKNDILKIQATLKFPRDSIKHSKRLKALIVFDNIRFLQ